jgi:hypothetical protein
MTLIQISEILAERAGRQFDIPFKKELEDLVVIHRARILTNSLQKNPALKKYYSQSIILELEEVNKDECDEIAECNCENVLRTKEEIPEVLKIGVNPYDYFGSPGGAQAYGWTTFAAEQYLAASTYIGKRIRYTRLNNRGYVFNEKNAEKIRVEDVFADPRKLANFSCSAVENIPCYSATSDFVADEAVAQLVIESILTKELRLIPQEEKIEIKTDKNV